MDLKIGDTDGIYKVQLIVLVTSMRARWPKTHMYLRDQGDGVTIVASSVGPKGGALEDSTVFTAIGDPKVVI